MGWNPLKFVEKNILRPIVHAPVVGNVLGTNDNKAMREYHRNAERMYNEQSAHARNAQSRLDSERQMQTQGRNRSIARTNRARTSGGVFRDDDANLH